MRATAEPRAATGTVALVAATLLFCRPWISAKLLAAAGNYKQS